MTKANSVTDVVNDGNKWKVEAINKKGFKKGFNDTLEDLSFSVSLKVSNDLRLPSHRHGMSELKKLKWHGTMG